MPRLENPIVLVTRPAPEAAEFIAMLRRSAGPFEAVVCPAFSYEPSTVQIDPFDIAIFTSRAGVAHAPMGEGRTAYCVGNATARLAQTAGYVAISANGSAEELIAMILDAAPRGVMLHIRGEISRGDVAARLKKHGFNSKEAIVYRKVSCDPTANAVAHLKSGRDVIIPVFSAETVSIIEGWALPIEGRIVVAISDTVAKAAYALKSSDVLVSDHPDMRSMSQATVRLIA